MQNHLFDLLVFPTGYVKTSFHCFRRYRLCNNN